MLWLPSLWLMHAGVWTQEHVGLAAQAKYDIWESPQTCLSLGVTAARINPKLRTRTPSAGTQTYFGIITHMSAFVIQTNVIDVYTHI